MPLIYSLVRIVSLEATLFVAGKNVEGLGLKGLKPGDLDFSVESRLASMADTLPNSV